MSKERVGQIQIPYRGYWGGTLNVLGGQNSPMNNIMCPRRNSTLWQQWTGSVNDEKARQGYICSMLIWMNGHQAPNTLDLVSATKILIVTPLYVCDTVSPEYLLLLSELWTMFPLCDVFTAVCWWSWTFLLLFTLVWHACVRAWYIHAYSSNHLCYY